MKFSDSICSKFPVQTGRHEATLGNAGWLCRNVPITPLTPEDKAELRDFIRKVTSK